MLQAFKAKLIRGRVRLCVCLTLVVVSLVGSAFASEPDTGSATIDTIKTMTVTQLTAIQQALLSLIQSIVPVALVVMGSVLVVTFGIRFFRRFAG